LKNTQITYHAHRTWFDEDPSKGSKSIAIHTDYNPISKDATIKLKGYERPTSNFE